MNNLRELIERSEYNINRWTNESTMLQYKPDWPRLMKQVKEEKIKLTGYREALAKSQPDVVPPKITNKVTVPYTAGEAILRELSLFPESKVLIDEAQKALKDLGLGPLDLRVEQTRAGFDGEQGGRTIRIKPGLTPERQRYVAIFELTNIINYSVHLATRYKDYASADDYARAKEYTEYNGLIRALKLAQEINAQKGPNYVKTNWEGLNPEEISFEHFYRHVIAEEHKNYYKREWANYT
jgi:hypothetical protein